MSDERRLSVDVNVVTTSVNHEQLAGSAEQQERSNGGNVASETSSDPECVPFDWRDIPPSHWLQHVAEPPCANILQALPWPIEEPAIRRVARKKGMLLERLGTDRYRLWDIWSQVRLLDYGIPVDLTAESEYVDCLAGIACFLWWLD